MNPHERKAHKILSLARLPIPPLAHMLIVNVANLPRKLHYSIIKYPDKSKNGKILSMNPTDPFKPITNRPTSTPPPRPDAVDASRNSVADVARSQIEQIFGPDGRPNTTLSHSNQPMIDRPARPVVAPAEPSRPAPTPVQPQAQTVKPEKPAEQPEPVQSVAEPRSSTNEAHRKYHSAWQDYYKTYYERYYVSELAQQKQQFAAGQASIKDDSPDGSFTQKEAIDELKGDLRHKISTHAKKVRKSRHFMPAVAAVVVLLLAAFVQYNGLLFAQVSAFISPGSSTSQDIIVGTGADQEVSSDPRIIIPKISVNAPVIYGLDDLSENSAQEALQSGVIHYPIAGANALPGQNGNTVILGHSSADFFEPGDYKFIFVQLNRLTTGDLFYLDYEGTRYTYRVNKTEIISPTDIGKLAIGDDKPYATLITCDPPGTAKNRLVVYGEQISPDPSKTTESQSSNSSATADTTIVGNPPTLFEQIFGN